MPSPFIIVAVDGGAASGKSSTSRALSERFNLLHVDTGSFYRTLTAHLLRRGISAADPAIVDGALKTLKLGTRITGRSAAMEVDGVVLPDAEIRSPTVNEKVSHFAALPGLRAGLLAYQRGQVEVARRNGFAGLIMEGRDIGSIIFPDADFRFFLQADPAERERRRAGQGQADRITERDRLDTQRKTAPLTCPPGAIAIDSTLLPLEEVVAQMAAPIARKLSS